MRIEIHMDFVQHEYGPETLPALVALINAAQSGKYRDLFERDNADEPSTAATDSFEDGSTVDVDATKFDAPTTAKRRGRKSNAEKEAEAAAATPPMFTPAPTAPAAEEPAAPIENTTAPVPQFTPAMGGTPPLSFTPNVYTAPTAPAAPPFNPQQAAMPPAAAAVIDPNETTLADLQAIMAQADAKQPGLAFQIRRRKQWRDGTEKAAWLTVEQVPAEMRTRLATETAIEAGL